MSDTAIAAGVGHDHEHHPALQHHFDTLEQQLHASQFGMWVFLVTEVLFFGGLFMAYILYRIWYPEMYVAASSHLNILLGGANTAVLIGSSLTMAFAVRSAQTRRSAADAGVLAGRDDDPRRGVPRREGGRIRGQDQPPPRARPELPFRRAVRPDRAALFLALLRDDRAARHAHDHRHRRSWR